MEGTRRGWQLWIQCSGTWGGRGRPSWGEGQRTVPRDRRGAPGAGGRGAGSCFPDVFSLCCWFVTRETGPAPRP